MYANVTLCLLDKLANKLALQLCNEIICQG